MAMPPPSAMMSNTSARATISYISSFLETRNTPLPDVVNGDGCIDGGGSYQRRAPPESRARRRQMRRHC
jgi:hypothetical protein